MKAGSEKTQLTLTAGTQGPSVHAIGSGNLAEALAYNKNGARRLELMVGTVLDRITRI